MAMGLPAGNPKAVCLAALATCVTPVTSAARAAADELPADVAGVIRAKYVVPDAETRYLAGRVDLNGDGAEEVLVHVVGMMVCGSESPAAGVDPTEARESGEIGVRRIQDVAALDRQGRQMRVGGEVARGSQSFEIDAEVREVRIGRVRHMDVGKSEPAVDPREHGLHREGTSEDLAVRRHPNQPEQRDPGESDSLAPRQAPVPPPLGASMHR
jgi:hypothetical protein